MAVCLTSGFECILQTELCLRNVFRAIFTNTCSVQSFPSSGFFTDHLSRGHGGFKKKCPLLLESNAHHRGVL